MLSCIVPFLAGGAINYKLMFEKHPYHSSSYILNKLTPNIKYS